MIRIAAALACHNRRDQTLSCLSALFAQELPDGIELVVFLTDDGSSDGTAAAVQAQFPQVRVLHGNGTLYWNGAMHLALSRALQEPFDFHLWLNDDVHLFSQAMTHLIDVFHRVRAETGTDPIVAGRFCDPETGKLTYGGQVRSSSWHPLRLAPAAPGPCHTFQGNGVLVPVSAVARMGIIDPKFSGFQEIGDTDYGLRASSQGIPVVCAPGYIGTCSANPEGEGWTAPDLTLSQRWAAFRGPKGIKAKNYLIYARRHAGWFWPVFWLAHLFKGVISLLKAAARPRS